MDNLSSQMQLIKPELPFEHFALQAMYAERAVELSGMPVAQAFMEYTQFWRRVGNPGWSFDPNAENWQKLINRINGGGNTAEAAYSLYLQNNSDPEAGKHYFGCFRYDFNAEYDGDPNIIKIHFKNRDESTLGPLTSSRMEARIRELQEMFKAIQTQYPQAQTVHGGSWLYNLQSYRRLFPAAYSEHMKVEEIPFPRTAGIWGQFLNSENKIKEDTAARFLDKIGCANDLDELLQCFEYKILFPRCTIEDFYRLYGLSLKTAHNQVILPLSAE